MDYEPESSTNIRLWREWAVLFGALVAILVGVEGLVRIAVRFGKLFGTPSFLWGITVVAAGTSVPDAFVSIRATRSGSAVTINYSVGAPMMAVLTVGTLIVFLMMRTDLLVSRPEAWTLTALYVLFIAWMGDETFRVVDLVPSLPPGT